MTTLLVGGEKGGTGKSTVATNLAVWLATLGRDVVLLDGDKMGSSKRWVDRRNDREDPLPVVHISQARGDVYRPARDLAARYQEVVIDAGGEDSKELRTAMAAADVMVIPTQASQFDLETMDHLNVLIGLARGLNPQLKAYALITRAPTNPMIREAIEAREFLGDFAELQLAGTVISERKVYRDAIVEGKGVIEMANNHAKAEIQLLGQELYGEQPGARRTAKK